MIVIFRYLLSDDIRCNKVSRPRTHSAWTLKSPALKAPQSQTRDAPTSGPFTEVRGDPGDKWIGCV